MKQYMVSLPLLASLALGACQESEIPQYDVNARRIYFSGEREHSVTFQFYPGTDTYEMKFPVRIIGQKLDEDRGINVKVVDSLTTALPEEYALPEPVVFHKGLFVDTLRVLLKRSARMDEGEVTLGLCLAANEHFDIGYPDSLTVQAKFSNLLRKPDWWTDNITNAILGEYSDAKYHYLIVATGIADYSGYTLTEMRKVRDEFQAALDVHPEWTEADGSEIVLPGY